MSTLGSIQKANRPFAVMGGLVLLALGLVVASKLSGIKADVDPAFATQTLGAFSFKDTAAGAVLVLDPKTGAVLVTLNPGTNGFLRATLRGLSRQRKAKGVGPDAPFHVVQHTTGHVSLIDPATGIHVALDAFGHTNVMAFARLLKERNS